MDYNSYLKEVEIRSGYNTNFVYDRIESFGVEKGWYSLIIDLIKELIDLGWNKQLSQSKEKFGTLRFYISDGTDEIYDVIDEYEEKSSQICEMCGNGGELRKGGWWKTLCDECNENKQ